MLTTQQNNNANNNNVNHNNTNKNNHNRGGGPIRVRGGNNRIIGSTILPLDSLLFDVENTTKLQAKDKTLANSISKINMETENPNEIAELQSEVERMNALITTEKLKAEFLSKDSVQYVTKVQESQKALADAAFYARTQAAEATLYAKKKESKGIVTLENNYTSVRGNLMINGGMFQEIAKISIWNHGGDNSVASGKFKDAFLSCT